jgi:hypothetical protein
MTLQAFQRALSDCIASPPLCLFVRAQPEEALASYELSERERRRLIEVIWQKGMSTNCTLYRVNRVTPVYSLLPLTCFLLGNALLGELELFWSISGVDVQFKREIDRFADFIRERLFTGALSDPYLEEVLDFELAANTLRFLPRRRIMTRLAASISATSLNSGMPAGSLRPHPLIRVVLFRHDPVAVLTALGELRPPVAAEEETYLVLDWRGDDLDLMPIDRRLASLLLGKADDKEETRVCHDALVESLISSELLVTTQIDP